MVEKRSYRELEKQVQELQAELEKSKRREEALSKSDRYYKALFEQGLDGVVVVDPETCRAVVFNDQVCQNLGYSRDEFAKLSIADIDALETEEEARIHIEKVLKNGSDDFQTLQRTKQGEIRHVHVTAKVIEVDGSKVYHCIWTDITDRRRAEEALRESETRFFSIFEYAPIGMAIVSPEGKFLKVNRATCDLLGYSELELLTKTYRDISHPDFLESDDAHLEQMLAGKIRIYQKEKRYIHKKRHAIWALLSVSLIWDQQQEPAYFISQLVNITDRKLAEEKLRLALQRLNFHMENSPLAVVEFNTAFEVIYWSRQAERIFGWNSQEIVGKKIDQVRWVHEDDVESVARLSKNMLNGRSTSNSMTNRNYSKDGSVLTCEWYNSVLLNGQGELVSVLSLVLDITERKRSETAVERQNTLLKGINRIFGAVVTSAGDKEFGGICLDVAEKITGSSISFLGEISPDGVLHDIAVSNPTWNACSVFKSGKIPKNFHTYGIYARVIVDGKPLLINNPASPPSDIVFPTGHPPLTSLLAAPLKHGEKTIGMVAVGNRKGGYGREEQAALEVLCQVITESLARRRTEEALREGEVRYRSLFMHSPDAIYINQQDRITLVNDACLRLFGAWTAGELLGKTPYDLFHTDYHQVIRERIRRMRHQGESQPLLEGKIVRLDGGIVDVEVIAAHFPFGGSKAIHVILRDITERRRAAENLQRSNKELEQFAYAASHDLQEPLRSIVGFLQLLQHNYGDQLDEKGRQYVERVVAAGHRMQIMIRDLLSLSRVTTSNGTFLPTNLNSLVKTVLDNLESTLQENHAEVVYADLPSLSVDSSQIQSLFQNLILNSIKYNMNPNPRVEIGCSPSGNFYQFFVRDNGIGISPRFYERIFIVFQRLHTAREYDGTGLGLALCRKIVERHGGKIWVESVPGEGSTFFFTLPAIR
ncbi:PAS domain S-box protein [Desulfopila inferna]|uniref:PAS domain S-box protein n=1 Tax=Desulfopila inferna TaxID=468528 RepID=UPI00196280C3|nr:PAS domain S-box protein [Desulfopila inferna]MBM9604450.1 PAS domain S-box protein [Desulfopila inferna]